MTIWTASWFAQIQPHTPVSISRSAPRGRSGFKIYDPLRPGPWFQEASVPDFLRLYNEILAKLDPYKVVVELHALGPNPTLLGREAARAIAAGHKCCHRHIVAQWLEDSLGIKVPEVGFPDLQRFRCLEYHRPPITAPSYPRDPLSKLLTAAE